MQHQRPGGNIKPPTQQTPQQYQSMNALRKTQSHLHPKKMSMGVARHGILAQNLNIRATQNTDNIASTNIERAIERARTNEQRTDGADELNFGNLGTAPRSRNAVSKRASEFRIRKLIYEKHITA